MAILAVLVSAIAAGSGAFTGDTSDVKLKAQATAILEYVGSVKMGVDRVISRCPDTQISLANSVDSGYVENPLAPSDKSCHVFDANGGGVLFKEPPADIDLTSVTSNLRHYMINTENEPLHFGKAYGFSGVPVTTNEGRDLVILLPGIQKELCLKINDMVGVTMESGDAPSIGSPRVNKEFDYWRREDHGWRIGCGPNINRSKVSCCGKMPEGASDPQLPIGSYVFFSVLYVR